MKGVSIGILGFSGRLLCEGGVRGRRIRFCCGFMR